jgi:hypothetical protein
MLVAIAALALIVVFLAQKPVPGSSGATLPNPNQVAATGTDGIPSPAKSLDLLAGTSAGQLVMDANPQAIGSQPLSLPPPLPGGQTMTSAPQGPPGQKDLIPPPSIRTSTGARTFGGKYRKL